MRSGFTMAAGAAVAAASFLVGGWYQKRQVAGAPAAVTRYHCPMHPQFVSDRPGTAPCCGMRLEPLPERGAPVRSATVPGSVEVVPGALQWMGVRVAPVARAAATRRLRASGRIVPDETRIYRINTSTESWVRQVYPPTTGALVRRDQPLLALYTNSFQAAAQAYLYALNTRDRHAAAQSGADQMAAIDVQLRQAVESLRNLGVSEAQIREIAETRKLTGLVTIRAPVSGFILQRNATPGQWVGPGTELYQLADLARVWILADLFQHETKFIRPNQAASVTHASLDRVLTAKVSDVLPQFDPSSRTLRVRLEAANPGLALRPEMFVDVEFDVQAPAAVVVPAEAVVNTGRRTIVYVEKAEGRFEPRQVETGWRFGEQVEIAAGLVPGERIVVSGNFLIDSESRMRLAAEGHAGRAAALKTTVRDVVCGMQVDIAGAPTRTVIRAGSSYYFCSPSCERKFDENPSAYANATRATPGA